MKKIICNVVFLLTTFIVAGQTKKAKQEALNGYEDCKQLSADTSYFRDGQMAMLGIQTKCLVSNTSNEWLPVQPGETQSCKKRYSKVIIQCDTISLFEIPKKLRSCSNWDIEKLSKGYTVARSEFDKGSFWSGAVIHNRLFALKNSKIEAKIGKETKSTRPITLFVYGLTFAMFYFLFIDIFIKIFFNMFIKVRKNKNLKFILVNLFFIGSTIFSTLCIAVVAAVICDQDKVFITNPYFWVNDILCYFLIVATVVFVFIYKRRKEQLEADTKTDT